MNSASERLVRRAQRRYLRCAVAEIFVCAAAAYLILWFVHPIVAVALYLWAAYVILQIYWGRCSYVAWYAEQRTLWPHNVMRRPR